MDHVTLATFDSALAPGGKAAEWVHLLRAGDVVARDGRTFEGSDPAALVSEFVAGGVDLPIDCEHQNDRPAAKLAGPVRAAGWINALQATEDGICGRVEGTANVRREKYRFLSPSLLFDRESKQVWHLKGAGLVHRPALFLTALASHDHVAAAKRATR